MNSVEIKKKVEKCALCGEKIDGTIFYVNSEKSICSDCASKIHDAFAAETEFDRYDLRFR